MRANLSRMLKSQVESLRRSQAMAPLSPSHAHQLLESCSEMAREREAIQRILTTLPQNWLEVRKPLNELHRIVAEERRPTTH